MANEKPNCKMCRYRIHLAKLADIHVWEEDCDKYGTDLCEKMNEPEFIKFMDERNKKKLIYADDARKAMLREAPHLAYCIDNIPAVDAVEVVHGRWAAIDDDCEELEGEEEARRWGCSACREIVEYDDWTHRSLLTRYCPNCGAKMDGDGNVGNE